jgi:hypothetical protein
MVMAPSPDLCRGQQAAGRVASELPAASPTVLIEKTIPLNEAASPTKA